MNIEKAKKTAEDLVSKMTVEEMMTQLLYDAPAIERLGIKEHNWWNEACHGVARNGVATVFPQSIGLAATFNPDLVGEIADVISTEARAKYNKSVAHGDRDIFKGLTFWAPNVNIFRDPRWGRGQETCGEDPFLTSSIASSFIKGLQGNGEFYKATACAKHFAAHSGPEAKRHSFNAEVDEKDMRETYLPAFEKTVEAGVAGVMGAYNRTNGEACCASKTLMKILRDEWGFDGYFVSDCWAIKDLFEGHNLASDPKEAAAIALNAGCELNCGDTYHHLVEAYEEDLISEEVIKNAALRLFTIRAALGEFEEERPYSDIKLSVVYSKEHKELNLKAAQQTLVLLENKNNFLPLGTSFNKRIAVIGPNAMNKKALEGNYHGHADEYITVADGIRKEFSGAEIMFADGCDIYQNNDRFNGFTNMYSEAVSVAEEADLVVLCLGLDRDIEGEDLGFSNDFTAGGDRKTMRLPECQMKLAEAVCDACENVVVVVLCGSCVDLGVKVKKRAKAIIHGWYPGAMGGLAIARLIAGEFSPSGRLPITFYSEKNTIPDIENYSMDGRTYRYFTEKPLYKFGYGLSYTHFEYSGFRIEAADDKSVTCALELKNAGSFDSDEKVQCYARFRDSRTVTPRLQLCAVTSEFLKAGESKTVRFDIDRYWLKAVLSDGRRVDPDETLELFVGGRQPEDEDLFVDLMNY